MQQLLVLLNLLEALRERTQSAQDKPKDDEPDLGGTRDELRFEDFHVAASSGSSATARRSA